jgi:short-subunit dehydrogenase
MGSHVTVQTLCPGFTYSEFHDTMAVRRERLASKPLWLSADHVVDASLEGLKKGRLYVIPGWRYKLLTAIISKLPTKMRLAVEMARGKARVETKSN